MSGKRDVARSALQRSAGFLASRHHDDILDALSAEGLLDEPRNAENGGRLHAWSRQTQQDSLLCRYAALCPYRRADHGRDLRKAPARSRAKTGRSCDRALGSGESAYLSKRLFL